MEGVIPRTDENDTILRFTEAEGDCAWNGAAKKTDAFDWQVW